MKEKLLKLLFAFLACCSSAANAADGESAEILVLKFADARTVKFLLADKPEISFADGKLIVTSQSLTTNYEQSQVVEFHFTSVALGVDKNIADDFSFSYLDNTSVSVSGTHARSVSLYDISGRLVKRQHVEQGCVNVSREGCTPGTYILNLEGEHSFKIVKK